MSRSLIHIKCHNYDVDCYDSLNNVIKLNFELLKITNLRIEPANSIFATVHRRPHHNPKYLIVWLNSVHFYPHSEKNLFKIEKIFLRKFYQRNISSKDKLYYRL